MSDTKVCDICRTPDLTTKRYGLSRQARDPNDRLPDGRGRNKRSFSCGGIDLCDRCWTRACKPKTKPHTTKAARKEHIT